MFDSQGVKSKLDLSTRLCVGVGVGSTNTDAVILGIILRQKKVLCSAKLLTTEHITSGVAEAMGVALGKLPDEFQPNPARYVARVNIGTTHFVKRHSPEKGTGKSGGTEVMWTSYKSYSTF